MSITNKERSVSFAKAELIGKVIGI